MNYDDEMEYLKQQRRIYEEFVKNDAIKLELGETYLQESSSWAKAHYKIVFIDNVIAVGIKTWCGIFNSNTKGCGTYGLFKAATGERYQDSRLCYRLKKR